LTDKNSHQGWGAFRAFSCIICHMFKSKAFLCIAVTFLLALSSGAEAESRRFYRYFDSTGKAIFVKNLKDVPAEFRSSASSVLVRPENAVEETSPPVEANGEGVRLVAPLKFAKAAPGKTSYAGDVKNFLVSSASDVKLTISVVMRTGEEKAPVVLSIGGKNSESALEAGETAKVSGVLDVDYAAVKKFGANLSWQTLMEEKRGAKPNEKTPSPANGK